MLGHYIGSTDANLHTHGLVLDEAGQTINEVLADGICENTYVLNALGFIITVTDAGQLTITYGYDRLNNVVAECHPMADSDRGYGYDQMQHRILIWDAVGNQTRYNHDVHGNIMERYLPLGQLTQTTSDHNGSPLKVINPGLDTMSWVRDFFGNIKEHIDLEGREYSYELNFKNQVKHHSMVKGSTWTSMEPHKQISYYPEDPKHEYPIVTFTPKLEVAKPQNVNYNYAYGLIKWVKCSFSEGYIILHRYY